MYARAMSGTDVADVGSKGTTTTATKTQQNKNTGGPIRLSSVQGYETRTNDIIYCPPLEKAYVRDGKDLQNTAVVYFGGDIQVSGYYD